MSTDDFLDILLGTPTFLLHGNFGLNEKKVDLFIHGDGKWLLLALVYPAWLGDRSQQE